MIHRIECGCRKLDPCCELCGGSGIVEYEEGQEYSFLGQWRTRKWRVSDMFLFAGLFAVALLFWYAAIVAGIHLYRMI